MKKQNILEKELNEMMINILPDKEFRIRVMKKMLNEKWDKSG